MLQMCNRLKRSLEIPAIESAMATFDSHVRKQAPYLIFVNWRVEIEMLRRMGNSICPRSFWASYSPVGWKAAELKNWAASRDIIWELNNRYRRHPSNAWRRWRYRTIQFTNRLIRQGARLEPARGRRDCFSRGNSEIALLFAISFMRRIFHCSKISTHLLQT